MDKDIKALAEQMRDVAEENWQALSAEWGRLHKRIETESFISRWEQMEAIRKLSQLGLALHASGEALRAIGMVRCN